MVAMYRHVQTSGRRGWLNKHLFNFGHRGNIHIMSLLNKHCGTSQNPKKCWFLTYCIVDFYRLRPLSVLRYDGLSGGIQRPKETAVQTNIVQLNDVLLKWQGI